MIINSKKLEAVDVISFDIFDTLLKRNVPNNSEIFNIIEKKSGVFGFAKKRIEAAHRAENKAINGEATYEEIYAQIDDISDEQRNELKQLELDVEKRYLQTNWDMKEVYDWCVTHNKKIIAVSDMYLSANVLNELLEENGFEVERIFVSCEEHENKRSGKLFDLVSKKINTKNVLHIWDSWKGDFFSPIMYGWKAVHYSAGKRGKNVLDCVIKNNCNKNYFRDLGFSVLGPILYAFSLWLNEKTRDMDTLLFFSRDGYIMKKAYEKISDKESSYVYVSRLSLTTATIWMHPQFEDIKQMMEFPNNFTLCYFVRKLGLDPQNISFERFHLDGTQTYEKNTFWNALEVKEFYNSIKEEVVLNSKKQYEWLFNYITPFLKGKVVGIVDIGWKATMQSKFLELLKANPVYKDCIVHGFYLGVEKQTADVEGFLYKSNQQTTFKTAIDAGYGVIETLFLAREGTVIKYSQNGPVQAEYEIKTKEEIKNLQAIHEGAMEFIDKMRILDFEKDIPDPQEVFCYFENLVYTPQMEDLRLLGGVGFNDLNDSTLISRHGLLNYMVLPKRFCFDYHNAPWKIGFLKSNICRWFPWGKVYKKVKIGYRKKNAKT